MSTQCKHERRPHSPIKSQCKHFCLKWNEAKYCKIIISEMSDVQIITYQYWIKQRMFHSFVMDFLWIIKWTLCCCVSRYFFNCIHLNPVIPYNRYYSSNYIVLNMMLAQPVFNFCENHPHRNVVFPIYDVTHQKRDQSQYKSAQSGNKWWCETKKGHESERTH